MTSVPDAEFAGDPRAVRDARGRFLPGTAPGPGRPRGIDLKELIERKRSAGFDVEEAAWEVLESLRRGALAGDVAAAKIWLDRTTRREDAAESEDHVTLEMLVLQSMQAEIKPAEAQVRGHSPSSPSPK